MGSVVKCLSEQALGYKANHVICCKCFNPDEAVFYMKCFHRVLNPHISAPKFAFCLDKRPKIIFPSSVKVFPPFV